MAGQPTRELAQFAAQLEVADLPTAAHAALRRVILDQLGCALFGSTLPWSGTLRRVAMGEGGTGSARVWGTTDQTSASAAALINGTAGHAFEIDDLHTAGCFHPGAVVISAVLAVADDTASGSEVLAAITAGYEVGIRVGQSLGIAHFFRGFHPQGTVGAIAAAAGAGRMRRLSAEAMTHAIAIGACQGAGLMSAQEEGMVKRLHSGRAAQSGVLAALLAEQGFTGPQNVLEVPFGGFLSTLRGDKVEPAALTAGLGSTWELCNVGFKAYASCATVHSPLAAVEAIQRDWAFEPDAVDRVDVYVTTDAHLHSAFYRTGIDATGAQMSIPFGIAAMIVDGEVGGHQFSDARRNDPVVDRIARSVHVHPEPEFDALGETRRFTARVRVRLQDGRELEQRIDDRPGDIGAPLEDSHIESKFTSLVNSVEGIDAASLIAAVDALPEGTLRPVLEGLEPGRVPEGVA